MNAVIGTIMGLGFLVIWWELRRIHALVNSRYSRVEARLADALHQITALQARLTPP